MYVYLASLLARLLIGMAYVPCSTKQREREGITKSKHILVWKLLPQIFTPILGFFKACSVGLTDSYKTQFDYLYIASLDAQLLMGMKGRACPHLQLSAELVELLEDGHSLVLHLSSLELRELANLPAGPKTLPVLSQLPDGLDGLQILHATDKATLSFSTVATTDKATLSFSTVDTTDKATLSFSTVATTDKATLSFITVYATDLAPLIFSTVHATDKATLSFSTVHATDLATLFFSTVHTTDNATLS